MNKFLNPYSFIPLPETKRRHQDEGDDLFTGVIHYTIKTLTPTFIPNTSSDQAFQKTDEYFKELESKKEKNIDNKKHVTYDFFSYENLNKKKRYDETCHIPVIPGSELRGVIRSIYETLTDSCLSSLNGDTILSKRIPEPFRPGLVRKNGEQFELYEAKRLEYVMSDNSVLTYRDRGIFEGQKKYFDKSKIFRRDGNTSCILIENCMDRNHKVTDLAGYLLKGEKGPSRRNNGTWEELKKYAGLFYIEKNEDSTVPVKVSVISDDDFKRLWNVINVYQKTKKDMYEPYRIALRKFVKGKGEEYFPVYYSAVKDSFDNNTSIIYLSPACITKEVYKHTLAELAGDFVPCSGKDICPACALFGRVDEKGKESTTSRVRFFDAFVEKEKDRVEDYYCNNGKPITLEVLGSPRQSNTEFYLERPENAKFWTYDYYVDNNSKIHIKDYRAKIRGRKFYWNWDWSKEFKFPNVAISNQNKTVRVLNRGITFGADLYFDKISEKELQRLIWILNRGGDPNCNITYKIGQGKPLGLGSIECKVLWYKKRILEFDPKTSTLTYTDKKYNPTLMKFDNDEQLGFTLDENVKNSFFEGFGNHSHAITIAYPYLEYQNPHPLKDGFKWYGKNRKIEKLTPRKDYSVSKSLPLVTETDRSLPCDPTQELEYRDNNQDADQGNRPLESESVYKAIIKGFDDNKKHIKLFISEAKREFAIPFRGFDKRIRDYNKFKGIYKQGREIYVTYTKPVFGDEIIEVAKNTQT